MISPPLSTAPDLEVVARSGAWSLWVDDRRGSVTFENGGEERHELRLSSDTAFRDDWRGLPAVRAELQEIRPTERAAAHGHLISRFGYRLARLIQRERPDARGGVLDDQAHPDLPALRAVLGLLPATPASPARAWRIRYLDHFPSSVAARVLMKATADLRRVSPLSTDYWWSLRCTIDMLECWHREAASEQTLAAVSRHYRAYLEVLLNTPSPNRLRNFLAGMGTTSEKEAQRVWERCSRVESPGIFGDDTELIRDQIVRWLLTRYAVGPANRIARERGRLRGLVILVLLAGFFAAVLFAGLFAAAFWLASLPTLSAYAVLVFAGVLIAGVYLAALVREPANALSLRLAIGTLVAWASLVLISVKDINALPARWSGTTADEAHRGIITDWIAAPMEGWALAATGFACGALSLPLVMTRIPRSVRGGWVRTRRSLFVVGKAALWAMFWGTAVVACTKLYFQGGDLPGGLKWDAYDWQLKLWLMGTFVAVPLGLFSLLFESDPLTEPIVED